MGEMVEREGGLHGADPALRVLGGIHATFMFQQVLTEAPWVDVIVRGIKAGLPLFDVIFDYTYDGVERVTKTYRGYTPSGPATPAACTL